MPTLPPPWEQKAKAADNAVLAYRGITKRHLQTLKEDGLDVSTYEAAQAANANIVGNTKAATRQKLQAAFILEKRKILQLANVF